MPRITELMGGVWHKALVVGSWGGGGVGTAESLRGGRGHGCNEFPRTDSQWEGVAPGQGRGTST